MSNLLKFEGTRTYGVAVAERHTYQHDAPLTSGNSWCMPHRAVPTPLTRSIVMPSGASNAVVAWANALTAALVGYDIRPPKRSPSAPSIVRASVAASQVFVHHIGPCHYRTRRAPVALNLEHDARPPRVPCTVVSESTVTLSVVRRARCMRRSQFAFTQDVIGDKNIFDTCLRP